MACVTTMGLLLLAGSEVACLYGLGSSRQQFKWDDEYGYARFRKLEGQIADARAAAAAHPGASWAAFQLADVAQRCVDDGMDRTLVRLREPPVEAPLLAEADRALAAAIQNNNEPGERARLWKRRGDLLPSGNETVHQRINAYHESLQAKPALEALRKWHNSLLEREQALGRSSQRMPEYEEVQSCCQVVRKDLTAENEIFLLLRICMNDNDQLPTWASPADLALYKQMDAADRADAERAAIQARGDVRRDSERWREDHQVDPAVCIAHYRDCVERRQRAAAYSSDTTCEVGQFECLNPHRAQ